MELLKQRASADMSLGDGKRFPRYIFDDVLPQADAERHLRLQPGAAVDDGEEDGARDVFGMDLVLVPIHCNGNHWTLAVINFVDKRFEYHDPLRGSGRHVIKNLRDWLWKESADKRKCEREVEEIAGHLNDGEWRNGWRRRSGARDPAAAQRLRLRRLHVQEPTTTRARRPLNFTQADIDYFRRRIVLEIRNCALIDDDPPPGAA